MNRTRSLFATAWGSVLLIVMAFGTASCSSTMDAVKGPYNFTLPGPSARITDLYVIVAAEEDLADVKTWAEEREISFLTKGRQRDYWDFWQLTNTGDSTWEIEESEVTKEVLSVIRSIESNADTTVRANVERGFRKKEGVLVVLGKFEGGAFDVREILSAEAEGLSGGKIEAGSGELVYTAGG